MTIAELLRRHTRYTNRGCLLWTGAVNRQGGAGGGEGYGKVTWHGRTRLVHRVVYEELVGPIPAGKDLDHVCRVRNCVAIKHLRVVTRRENLKAVGSLSTAARTHCPKGHENVPENRYGGKHNCKICGRIRDRQRYARKSR